ncbi:MAG: hypothetical protein CMJ29_12555 [Phycisphaerae bacterium]|nr:hypothetical protein [Phycisphaerae bacterium]|tara:strand:- start:304 stop:1284 length:981 start_codon:yes stop_codon:yes gene_type:complete
MTDRSVLKLALLAGLLTASPAAMGSECCVADFTGDETVSADEVLSLLGGWGPCTGQCEMDIDDSGDVGTNDLLIVIDRWGDCPAPNDGPLDSGGDYMDLTMWGHFHGSNNNSHPWEMVDGRIAITTEAMEAFNNFRAFLGLSSLSFEQVGQWAFNESLTNNSQWWGNDLKGVGLYYAMQGAKVGWITDDAYDPQILADIQRKARTICDPLEMKSEVMGMVRDYGIPGYADYLQQNGIVNNFINTLKMEPHYAGWMHGRCHGFRSVEGVAINHDLNHLTVLNWAQTLPFYNDTFDWPQWDARDVSDSGVIEYFQSMVILGDPLGDNM